jgi:cell division septation protein DedD
MAEASPQNNQPQPAETQEAARPYVPPPRPPVHPMMPGGYYVPAPVALPPDMGARNDAKTSKNITLGNLSLFAIVFSLILLGSFTFLGGFLLGIWFAGPVSSPYAMTGRENGPAIAPQGGYPQQYRAAPQQEYSAQGQEMIEGLGDTARETVSMIRLPDVPEFLKPVLEKAHEVVGEQAAHETEQALQQSHQSPVRYSQPQPRVSRPQPMTSYAPSSTYAPSSAYAPSQRPAPPNTMIHVPSPPTQPLSQQEEGAYAVQLGLYAAKENAEALQNNLRELHYTSYIREGKSPEGDTVYYVNSGPYKDYVTASTAASHFSSQHIVPGAVVVKLSKNGRDVS